MSHSVLSTLRASLPPPGSPSPQSHQVVHCQRWQSLGTQWVPAAAGWGPQKHRASLSPTVETCDSSATYSGKAGFPPNTPHPWRNGEKAKDKSLMYASLRLSPSSEATLIPFWRTKHQSIGHSQFLPGRFTLFLLPYRKRHCSQIFRNFYSISWRNLAWFRGFVLFYFFFPFHFNEPSIWEISSQSHVTSTKLEPSVQIKQLGAFVPQWAEMCSSFSLRERTLSLSFFFFPNTEDASVSA